MTPSEFKQKVMPAVPRMYRSALSLTLNAADAEDAVQDALERLWQRRESLTGVESVEAYCLAVARHCAADIASRRKPRGEMTTEPAVEPAGDIETADRACRVVELIESLPAQQARIITMRDVDGLSIEEISDATGLSAGNIRTALSRARNKIRTYFSTSL